MSYFNYSFIGWSNGTSVGVEIMWYYVLFLIGFGLAVSGGVTIIAYLNFLPAGITWYEYFVFIRGRIECYFFPIGILIQLIVILFFPEKHGE